MHIHARSKQKQSQGHKSSVTQSTDSLNSFLERLLARSVSQKTLCVSEAALEQPARRSKWLQYGKYGVFEAPRGTKPKKFQKLGNPIRTLCT